MKRLPLILILLVSLAAMAASSVNDERNARAARARAAYLYYQANTPNGDDMITTEQLMAAAAAHAADPSDMEAAALYGRYMIIANPDDEDLINECYGFVKKEFFSAPDEFNGYVLYKIAEMRSDAETALAVYRTLAAIKPDHTDLLIDFADNLAQLGRMGGNSARVDSAINIYADIESRMGPDPRLIVRQLWAAGENADTAAIIAKIHDYVATAPAEASVLEMAGAMFKVLELPDSTLAYYDRACEADSTLGRVFLSRADLLLSMGDSARYDTEVLNVLRSPSIEFADKFEMLRQYTAKSYTDPARAAEIDRMYDVMQDIHPGESELYKLRGAYFLAVDSAARADEQLQYAVALDPTDFDSQRMLMTAAVERGDSLRAIEIGRIAVPLFPDNLYFPIVTSSMMAMMKDFSGALDVLDSFDVEGFDNPSGVSAFYQQRADVLYQLGMPDSAFVTYEHALDLDPSNSMAMNNYAYFLSLTGRDLDRAERLITTALRYEPENPTLIDTYAWVLFKEKKYAEARLQIDLALAQYGMPDNGIAADEKASPETAHDRDIASQEDEAVEIVEDIEQKHEISADVLDHAGDIYFMNGEPARALEFWKQALNLAPDNSKIARKVKHKTYFFDDDE